MYYYIFPLLLFIHTYQLFPNFKTSIVDTKRKAKCRVQNPLCRLSTHINRCNAVPPQILILTIPPPYHHIEVFFKQDLVNKPTRGQYPSPFFILKCCDIGDWFLLFFLQMFLIVVSLPQLLPCPRIYIDFITNLT